MLTQFWLGSLKEGDHSEDPGVDGWIILKCILMEKGLREWIGFNRLRTETSVRSL
jgi:hypothetical protein